MKATKEAAGETISRAAGMKRCKRVGKHGLVERMDIDGSKKGLVY